MSAGEAFFRRAETDPTYKAAEAQTIENIEQLLPIAFQNNAARERGDWDEVFRLSTLLTSAIAVLPREQVEYVVLGLLDGIAQAGGMGRA